jgi:peptide/nickel transport system substrate-binding protein
LAGSAAAAVVGTTSLARPAVAQGASAKLLRFVPQANLANPDPVWTTATVAIKLVTLIDRILMVVMVRIPG